MPQEIQTQVAIIGAGTAGLFALREVRRAGKDFFMIDPGPLGTTCARVGCMPSKAALHAAHLWHTRQALADMGVSGVDQLKLDRGAAWHGVQTRRDGFAGKTAGHARQAAGDRLLEGPARFLEPTLLEVTLADGPRMIRAETVIIANGSRPVRPDWLDAVRDRVVTTDELFELNTLPDRVGVLGLGAIGLEMGLALARLGVQVVGADVADRPAAMHDPAVAERMMAVFGKEMTLWLGQAAKVSPVADGVLMEGAGGQQKVDLILAALGRRPNTDRLQLAQAGFPLDPEGALPVNPATLQLGDLPVFVAGDANGQRPLMHEAADEGAIAGYNAAHWDQVTHFRRRVPLAIAFTQPDIAVVGAQLDTLDPANLVIGSAEGSSNGRSVILGAQDSLVRLYADHRTGQLLGAALMAAGGEHLAHLLAWAIGRGETAAELLTLPFYHPVVEEILQAALQDVVRQLPQTSRLPVGLTAR
ncbi:dihydrolipoamide dehydrogenase [Ectothiorhodospira magna]|uniref:Dihydrolipoamide dehydrogenase n=1 Tax=Ectothiorhodospira magna TaxID=867345 RepID=A0A1H9AJJ8_9GAMM|nr:dihydrolipoyl dehydrogenase [Ectothiorhodospira magna]SEP76677.1 dihydrolipoamide dehydrogenase [Ectothiorhodospira magna]